MSRFNINRKAAVIAVASLAVVALAAPTTNAQGFSFGISRGGLTISHSSGFSRHFGTPVSRHDSRRPAYDSHYSDSHHVVRRPAPTCTQPTQPIYSQPVRHRVDVRLLDRYADQLAEVAEHLHDDAHQLSRGYEHSRAIESYVCQLEDLAKHMHELLHDQLRWGHLSASVEQHLSEDVRAARRLVRELDSHLHHQGFDGACPRDYSLMQHMRQVIDLEAYPLLYKLDIGLWGTCAYNTRGVISRSVGHGYHR